MNQPVASPRALKVFISYSHEDDALRMELVKHLSQLRREGLIEDWHDRLITGGREWAGEIDDNLEAAEIVLLLVSASFLASDYCYDKEMTRALERHDAHEAPVLPVILRPCDWQTAPFGKLQAFPKDGKPIVEWQPVDAGYLEVARGLRRVIAEMQGATAAGQTPPPPWAPPGGTSADAGRQVVKSYPYAPKESHDKMETQRFNPRRLSQLEELLDIEYEKLHEFEKAISLADGVSQKIALRQQVKRDLTPHLRKLEEEYANLLSAGVRVEDIPDDEAQMLVAEVVDAVVKAEGEKTEKAPEEMVRLLTEIRDKLQKPGKSAAAKLKVTLPIIPLIASYEMELDTEGVVTQVWQKARDLFKRVVDQNPQ